MSSQSNEKFDGFDEGNISYILRGDQKVIDIRNPKFGYSFNVTLDNNTYNTKDAEDFAYMLRRVANSFYARLEFQNDTTMLSARLH